MKKNEFNEQNEPYIVTIKIDEIGTYGFKNYSNNITRKLKLEGKRYYIVSSDLGPSFLQQSWAKC